MLNLEIFDLKDIETSAKIFVEYISSNCKNVNCFAMYGKMGAGKTTFIKAVCKELKVKDEVTSPTFAIVNEYFTENDEIIYHFDFYRINKIEEVYDLGYEEYFYSKNICFIEWPEMIEDILPENFLKVNIQVEDNKRIVKI